MATRKPKMTQAELRAFRSDWAKLRSKGLVKNDARSQKPTKHAKSQLKKYHDVLAGNADVVTVPRKEAKRFDAFVRSGNHVVVPKAKALGGGSQRTRYSPKTKDIVRTIDYGGGTRVTSIAKTGFTEEELRRYEGPNTTFAIYVARSGGYQIYRRRKVSELAEIFADGSWKNFENWASYVMVETSSKKRKAVDEDEGGDDE